jgi:hypothetical protein
MRIIILEDNDDRCQVMKAALAGKFSSFAIEFFAAAQPLIDHLKATGMYDVAIVSLDHDLEMIPTAGGTLSDPGTGTDVAAWLAVQPAIFPVVVHTTNSAGGDRMMELLVRGGWTARRVVPFCGEDWITDEWYPLIRKQIVRHAPRINMASLGMHLLKAHWQSTAPVENLLREAIKAATFLATGACQSNSLLIQLLYLDSGERLVPLLPDNDSFSTVMGNLTVMVDEVGEMEPTSVEAPDLIDYRSFLEELEFRQLQITILRFAAPEPMEAVMIAATNSDQFRLEGQRVQTVLAELGILIEIALLAELRKSNSTGKQQSESLIS